MSSASNRPRVPIGIDGSRLTGTLLTGTETYALELLEAMAPLCQSGEVEVYLNCSLRPGWLPPTVLTVEMPFPRFWTHGRLSARMLRKPPGVLFVPAHVIPVKHPRSVATIHDLAYRVRPDCFSRRERIELDRATRWNIAASKLTIAVSEQTRQDMVHHYGADPDRIIVVHHGVNPRFFPATVDSISETRARLGLPERYVLSVGTLHPRKNLTSLIEAFEHARSSGLQAGLVLCGTAGTRSAQIIRRLERSPYARDIHWLRYVAIEDLPAIYSGASLFMLPTWYEGFGMPAIEAMACGAAVAVSSGGALPEICGPAARYFEPGDGGAMIEAMLEIESDPSALERRRIEGPRQSSRYTWSRSAATTLAILRHLHAGVDPASVRKLISSEQRSAEREIA